MSRDYPDGPARAKGPQCAEMCFKDTKCLAFNYDKQREDCELCDDDIQIENSQSSSVYT